jgi:hypothetical protein
VTPACQRCDQHPATTVYTWPPAELPAHYNFGPYLEQLCGCCAAAAELADARRHAATIPALEATLAAACDATGETPPEVPLGYYATSGYGTVLAWRPTAAELWAWMETHPADYAETRRGRRPDLPADENPLATS